MSVATGNVALVDDVARVLETVAQSLRPLRGIVHAAGIVADGTLLRLNRDRLRSVMTPKVAGAWNLHNLTRDVPLDFFVLFSSVISLVGFPGLGNYAAANAFLDALAHHRRVQGLSALSVNWAHWVGFGMAERPGVRQLFCRRGVGGLTRARGLQALGFLLSQDRHQVAVMPINWRRYVETRREGSGPARVESLLREQVHTPSDGNTSAAKKFPARARIVAAEPGQRQRIVESILVEHAAAVLGLSPCRLDVHQPLGSLGLDSLMAIELGNRLVMDFGVRVSVVRFLENVSLKHIAGELWEQLDRPGLQDLDLHISTFPVGNRGAKNCKEQDEGSRSRVIDSEEARRLLARIDDLSNSAVDALLDRLMETDGDRH